MRCSNFRLMACAVFCLTLSVYGSQAHASGYYVGLDGSAVSVDNTVDSDVDPRGIRFRLGTNVSRFFDLEAQFGGAIDNETRAFSEFSAAYAGFYLKGYLPLGRRSSLFALAGGAAVELTQTIGRGRFSDDRGSFSYGFGLETRLSRNFDISADFMQYSLDDDEFSGVSAINLGLKYYF